MLSVGWATRAVAALLAGGAAGAAGAADAVEAPPPVDDEAAAGAGVDVGVGVGVGVGRGRGGRWRRRRRRRWRWRRGGRRCRDRRGHRGGESRSWRRSGGRGHSRRGRIVVESLVCHTGEVADRLVPRTEALVALGEQHEHERPGGRVDDARVVRVRVKAARLVRDLHVPGQEPRDAVAHELPAQHREHRRILVRAEQRPGVELGEEVRDVVRGGRVRAADDRVGHAEASRRGADGAPLQAGGKRLRRRVVRELDHASGGLARPEVEDVGARGPVRRRRPVLPDGDRLTERECALPHLFVRLGQHDQLVERSRAEHLAGAVGAAGPVGEVEDDEAHTGAGRLGVLLHGRAYVVDGAGVGGAGHGERGESEGEDERGDGGTNDGTERGRHPDVLSPPRSGRIATGRLSPKPRPTVRRRASSSRRSHCQGGSGKRHGAARGADSATFRDVHAPTFSPRRHRERPSGDSRLTTRRLPSHNRAAEH